MSSTKLHNYQSNEHLSQQVIQQYLLENLSDSQMHLVEKHLLSCKLCSDALEGLAFAPNPGNNARIIEGLKHQIHKRATKKETKVNPFIWKPIGIAATISILLAISLLLFTPDSNTLERRENISLSKDKEQSGIESSKIPKDEAQSAIVDTQVPTAGTSREDNIALQSPASKKDSAPLKRKSEQFDIEKNESLPPDVALDQIEEELSNKESLTALEVEAIEFPKSETAQPSAPQISKVPDSAREATGVTHNLITITGRVVASEDKAALPGVNVKIKGTTTGTVTDEEGKYVLTVPQGSTLAFNFIGYTTKELTVQNKKAADVEMEADVQALSEVVVIDYGSADTEKKPYEYIRPKPAEGNDNFKNYIKNNLKYPPEAREKNIEGTVKVDFMVETNGQLSDFRIRKSLGFGCDEEAIRLLKEGPAWKPAQVNDKPVRRKVNVSIPFKL